MTTKRTPRNRRLAALFAAASALAPASAQAPQASTETGEVDVSRVWEALRDRDERIRGLEYLVRYETGRKVNEIEDFVWQRCKILSPELLWHEQYHGDASGETGFDESWTIRIATPALCQELLPAARTFRRLHLEHAARVFDPPPVYLVAVAWWPGPEPGPKTGDMPLSVEESVASPVTDPKGATPWSARRNASGSVTLSRSDLGMEIDVEPSKGYAISRRSFRVQANTVQYDVSDFREIDGVWLPSIVTQTVRGSQGVTFTLRCQALEMRVGRLTERDFERPHLPGLYDVGADDRSEADLVRVRQLVPGGEELLALEAERVRRRFASLSPWTQWIAWSCAFAAGACLAWLRAMLVIVGSTETAAHRALTRRP
ncbi:MAG: hypothetical protein ACK5BN_04690 [Planctomycetota bacterium]